MINKEWIKLINPNQKEYNSKYSEGTYKFLSKNSKRDIKIYRRKQDCINEEIASFKDVLKVYPTQIYFMFKSGDSVLGTSWTNIMQNKYRVMDYSYYVSDEFEEITDWFCEEYLRVGRCLFDSEHINFLLGRDHAYVTKEERFEIKDNKIFCRWCGKEVYNEKI